MMIKSIALQWEKIQWYFKKINSKNIYAKNIENEEIVNLYSEVLIMYL
jgi:hypothetical protein